MAKTVCATTFEIGDHFIRAGSSQRAAKIGFHREDGRRLVVDLDSVDAWEDGAEILLDDLNRLLALIEHECDERGIEVEFE